MSYEEKLNQFAAELIADLRTNYNDMGLRASGRWASSLNSEVDIKETGFSISIKGQNYTNWLENGRLPNSNQDKQSLRKWVGWAGNTFLRQWVQDKSLPLNPFAVAYKIARDGIKVPNSYNRGGLVSDVVTLNRNNALVKEMGTLFTVTTKSEIIKTFKNGN